MKKQIFDFNHIDPRIGEEELTELKNLFRFHHKRHWCFKKAHKHFKRMNLILNLTSTGLIAIGTIAGGVTMNPVVLGVISGWGLVLKTLNEIKNYESKIEMAKFVFTNYANTLTDLRFFLRGVKFDRKEFLFSTRRFDEVVNELGLNLEKFEREYDKLFE